MRKTKIFKILSCFLFKPLTVWLIIAFLSLKSHSSQEVPQSFSLDGRAYSDTNATVPLLDTISTQIQILNAAQDCILYAETQTIITSGSNGYFTIQVGSATGDPKRSGLDSAHIMSAVFANTGSISGKKVSDSTACTYNPIAGDKRYLRILMTPAGDSILRILSPNASLDSVPYAIQAERCENLQGFSAANFIQVNTTTSQVSQASLESFFSSASEAIKVPSISGNPGTPASGQIWYDTGSSQLKYYDTAVRTVASTGNSFANGGNAFSASAVIGTTDANSLSLLANNITAATIDTSGNTLLNGSLSIKSTNPYAPSTWSNGTTTNITGTRNYITLNNNVAVASDLSINAAGYANDLGSAKLYVNGNVGVGVTSPAAPLDVNGDVKIGNSSATCSATTKGSIRYNNTTSVLEFCNGTSWNLVQAAACADATPAVFTFGDTTTATASTLTTSSVAQITGIDCTVPVQISGGGSPQFRICSDSGCSTVLQDWTSSPASISVNQYAQVRLTTGAAPGSTLQATVIIGSSASVWSVTNSGGDCTVASPAIGTICADGTVYAGLTPDGNVKMYTTRCDAGQTWNGTTCTGTRSTYTWDNGAGNFIGLGYSNLNTGKTNTYNLDGLSNADSPYAAAHYCRTLTEGGNTDWYLPAQNELQLLYDNHVAIGNLSSSGSFYYWCSTEKNTALVNIIRMNDGNISSNNKNQFAGIRCVRH